MKGIAKFLIRWLTAYAAGLAIGGLTIGLGIRFLSDNEPMLAVVIGVGIVLWFLWVRTAVGFVNRRLERW